MITDHGAFVLFNLYAPAVTDITSPRFSYKMHLYEVCCLPSRPSADRFHSFKCYAPAVIDINSLRFPYKINLSDLNYGECNAFTGRCGLSLLADVGCLFRIIFGQDRASLHQLLSCVGEAESNTVVPMSPHICFFIRRCRPLMHMQIWGNA